MENKAVIKELEATEAVNSALTEAELTEQRQQLAKKRYRDIWIATLFYRIPAWINPANGIALAVIALSLTLIIAAAWPAELATAAPILLGIASAGLIFATATILFFTVWEGFKHYYEWQNGLNLETCYDEDENGKLLVSAPKPYEGSYHHYLDTLFYATPVKQMVYFDKGEQFTPPSINKSSLIWKGVTDSQLGKWVNDHPVQATIVAIGISFTLLMVGICIGYFFGNNFCFDLLHPLFSIMQPAFSAGLEGLSHLPYLSFLSSIADPAIIEIIAAVFTSALPLVLVDAIRRFAQTEYEARQASDNLTDADISENALTLNNAYKPGQDPYTNNSDVNAWGYLTNKLFPDYPEKQFVLEDDDYEPVSESEGNDDLLNKGNS